MKICIINRSYPSNDVAEKNFIEPEIKAHINAGHNITIMPISLTSNISKKFTEEIKINSEITKKFTKKTAAISLVKSISQKYFWHELIKNFSKIFTSKTRFFNFVKFIIKAQIIFDVLVSNQEIYDIIYTYWCTGETVGALRYKEEINPHVKIISRMHGYDIDEERTENKDYIPYRTMVLERLDKVLLLSNTAKEYLQSKYQINDNKIFIAPLGVDTQTTQEKVEIDTLTFYSCSSPVAVKRLEFIYACLEKFAALAHNKIQWVHFGATQEDVDLNIKNKPNNLEISFTGFQSKDVILSTYQKSKPAYFINLSLSEGQPVSIMEAMSCGLPIIATDVGGVKEMLHGEGLLVSVHDTPDEAAEKIIHFLNSNTYQQVSENSLKIQRKFYDCDRNHNALASALDNL